MAQGESAAAAAAGASRGVWAEGGDFSASSATGRLTPLLSMWSPALFSAQASSDGRGSGGGAGGGGGGAAEEPSFGLVPVLDRQALMNVFQAS